MLIAVPMIRSPMTLCTQCGFDNSPGAELCVRCAARLPSAIPSTPRPSAVAGGRPAASVRAEGALASLILGSASILLCGLFTGIPALVVGHRAIKLIRGSRGRYQGMELAVPGLVMGYAGCALWLVFILGWTFLFRHVGKESDAAEADAVKAIRQINDAQGSYSRIYTAAKGRVYAGSLATLGDGPGHACPGTGTAEYACLLSGPLSMPECREPHWCALNGYKFQIQVRSYPFQRGQDYAITATPTDSNGGISSFCSTSDGIVRSAVTWSALQSGYDVEDCRRLKSVAERP